ncbi:AfsR/SARP family transcriptional regulator [Streptomyces misionensis]|uniref:AfsR/SARP family transcriptional regulator n=1 Tax=Streptomyces misionensis TaxID=67331 RepID=UPI00380E95FC
MEFRVLGRVEVVIDGRARHVGHARQQCVLAALLVDVGRRVSVDQLIDRVWGERPPQRARDALYSYLSRLRRVLAPAGGTGIERCDEGYLLRAPQDTVDLHRFRRLLERARAVDDAVAADDLYGAALALWRGEPFGSADSPWIHRLRHSLDQERLAAESDRGDHALRCGRHTRLLAELPARIEEHPLDERLVGQLMLALCRAGRAAEALDHYRRLRHRLAEELGVDPGERLQRLHQDILTGDPALNGGSEPADRGVAGALPRQLPPTVLHLAGREPELALLDAGLRILDDGPGTALIISVSGVAGVGKTTLAVHWARRVAGRFPDGQLYLDLRGFGPDEAPVAPAEAVRRLLEAVGVRPERIPADTQGRVTLLRSVTDGRRMLLVLDNARSADQVEPLLPGSPSCLVLVTSRRRLTGLVARHQAQHLSLDTLTTAAARELVAARLGAERAAAEPDAVTELAERCGRLPLALSIAAARAGTLPGLPIGTLVEELRDERHRLTALATGDSEDTDLTSVFGWSYDALSPGAARLFRLLAAHPGPEFTLPAAAAASGLTPVDTRARLAELVDAHLVRPGTAGRFLLHDLLRAYARARLATDETDEDADGAAHRIFDHYLHTALAADRLLDEHRDAVAVPEPTAGARPQPMATHDQAEQWFSAEHAVLLTAVQQAARTGFPGHAWRLAWAIGTHLHRRGAWQEWVETQRTALAAASDCGDRAGIAHARHGLGVACAWAGRPEEAHTHLVTGLREYGELADERGQAHTHRTLAWLAQRQGRPAEALEHAEETLRHYTAAGFVPGQASALNVIGWCETLLGRHPQALSACRRALDLFEQTGNRTGQAYCWDSLAHAYRGLDRNAEAIDCFQQALALFRALGDRYNQATTLTGLGDGHAARGEHAEARACHRQALDILRELGHPEADDLQRRMTETAPA